LGADDEINGAAVDDEDAHVEEDKSAAAVLDEEEDDDDDKEATAEESDDADISMPRLIPGITPTRCRSGAATREASGHVFRVSF
jgi:hypothetical protein